MREFLNVVKLASLRRRRRWKRERWGQVGSEEQGVRPRQWGSRLPGPPTPCAEGHGQAQSFQPLHKAIPRAEHSMEDGATEGHHACHFQEGKTPQVMDSKEEPE